MSESKQYPTEQDIEIATNGIKLQLSLASSIKSLVNSGLTLDQAIDKLELTAFVKQISLTLAAERMWKMFFAKHSHIPKMGVDQ